MPIHVELVTQERKVFDEPEADYVSVPAVEGEMGVLPHHAPVLTTMTFGELVVRKGNAEERFAIYGGVVDVRPDKVVVLADLAESSFDIDTEKAQAARERARQLIESGVPEEQNRTAVLELRRAELALKISNNMRNRSSVLRIVTQEEND
ncbi:MAG: ATP synthase F1 subunit epsilon [Anaerolineae bacterium]|nr:ATP synthase F1 subunit epsilon [Anaerolineae bacterium]